MPIPARAVPTEQELGDSLGWIAYEGIPSLILYGCTCGQVLYYFAHYYVSGDHTHVKALVALLWILDTSKIIADIDCGWDILIMDHGGSFSATKKIPKDLAGDFAVSCSTVFLIHCCHLHIIRKLLRNLQGNRHWTFFVFPAITMALVSYVAGIVGTVQAQTAADIPDALVKARLAGLIRAASAVLVDIYITVWFCYHLQDAKTGHTRTDGMVTKLINYAIARGVLTCAVQVTAFTLLTIDFKQKSLWFLIFYMPASTLYVNSILAMWNTRHYIARFSGSSNLDTWDCNISRTTTLEEPSIRSLSP